MRSIQNPKTGESIETRLSDTEAVELLKQRGNDFGRKMAEAYPKVSQCQHFWLMKLASELRPVFSLPDGSYDRLSRLFLMAFDHGLKQPRIRYKTPEGTFRVELRGDRIFVHCGHNRLGVVLQDGTFDGIMSDRQMLLFTTLCLDPITAAALWGKKMNRCCFCGLELSDERSVAMGYGPICADNWGLPWGHTTEGSEVFDVSD